MCLQASGARHRSGRIVELQTIWVNLSVLGTYAVDRSWGGPPRAPLRRRDQRYCPGLTNPTCSNRILLEFAFLAHDMGGVKFSPNRRETTTKPTGGSAADQGVRPTIGPHPPGQSVLP